MSFIVYYMENETPKAFSYGEHEMIAANNKIMELRRIPDVHHVCMSSELSGMVGKPGVDSIENGKTPDGHAYDWSKAERAGKMRRKDGGAPIARLDNNS